MSIAPFQDGLAERSKFRKGVCSNPTAVTFGSHSTSTPCIIQSLTRKTRSFFSCLKWVEGRNLMTKPQTHLRSCLAGQDTRPSPERPGFESRWRKALLQYFPKKKTRSKQSSSSIRPKQSIAIQTERDHIDGDNALPSGLPMQSRMQERQFRLFRELNPGPLAPEARIMPLDQTAS